MIKSIEQLIDKLERSPRAQKGLDQVYRNAFQEECKWEEVLRRLLNHVEPKLVHDVPDVEDRYFERIYENRIGDIMHEKYNLDALVNWMFEHFGVEPMSPEEVSAKSPLQIVAGRVYHFGNAIDPEDEIYELELCQGSTLIGSISFSEKRSIFFEVSNIDTGYNKLELNLDDINLETVRCIHG